VRSVDSYIRREPLPMTNSMNSKNIFLAVAIIASVYCAGAGNPAYAQPEPLPPETAATDPDHALESALAGGQALPFIYNRERPDPFFPFLTQEIMKAEAKAELTGTQKYEPAQLTLVAIVSGKRGFLAMVQDSSGIGYMLRKGTKIGENGEVVQIAHDKVIIEQSLKTVTGERTSRKIEMTLSKEGEK